MNKLLWVFHANILENGYLRAASWIEALYRSLTKEKGLDIVYVIPNRNVKQTRKTLINNETVGYYIPLRSRNICKVNKKTKIDISMIIKAEKPDIIQIFGTEFSVGLSTLYAAKELGLLNKTVIWLQGVCSLIEREYYSGLPAKIIFGNSLRDFLRRDNIRLQRRKFLKRGVNEQDMVRLARHIIGRTDWDKAWVRAISQETNYYHCDDILRSAFYSEEWEAGKCDRYRIFMSQGDYPIKGLHIAIKALAILTRNFPQTKLYIAGDNPISRANIRERLAESLYSKYLRKLIKKYKVEKNIVFTGRLSAEEMKRQYLKANVFLLPSFVENSPNSLGEAMLLGVPCVASNVGGVPSMILHKEEGFAYEKGSEILLAYYVEELFKDLELAEKIGKQARKRALITHNEAENVEALFAIYSKICKEENDAFVQY